MNEQKKVPLWRNPYVLIFIGGAIVLTLMRPMLRRDPKPPPVDGVLPLFSLTSEQGEKMGSTELAGQVYVANFLFTSCTTVCPLTVTSLQKLQKRYEERNVPVRIVSFSVDPNTDTPAKLREYGQGYLGKDAKPDFTVWQLATGTNKEVKAVADFFGLRYEIDPNDKTQFAHSLRTVVVAPDGKVRKVFSGNEWTTGELLKELQTAL